MASSNKEQIENAFPSLRGKDYKLTSPIDRGYNCIAWAAGCNHRFWWPNSYWPLDAPTEVTLSAFKQMFEIIGFVECETSAIEEEYEKIAIFKGINGDPSHAARQLKNGQWTSKLGPSDDIEHPENGLTGFRYGRIEFFMKRPILPNRVCPHP
jgi:hypothetical protein